MQLQENLISTFIWFRSLFCISLAANKWTNAVWMREWFHQLRWRALAWLLRCGRMQQRPHLPSECRLHQRIRWLQLPLPARILWQRTFMCGWTDGQWIGWRSVHHTEYSLTGARALAVWSMLTECWLPPGHLSMSPRMAWWWRAVCPHLPPGLCDRRRRMCTRARRRWRMYVSYSVLQILI